MSLFSPSIKAQVPEAQALVAQIAAKHDAAQQALAAADTEYSRLGLQFELPTTGIIVAEADLRKATAVRDRARETVERLGLALSEAQRRLDKATADDARATLDAAWAECERVRAAANTALDDAVGALKDADARVRAYLSLRDTLAGLSPAREERFGGILNGVIQTGIDRLVHVIDLTACAFSPRWRDDLAPTLEQQISSERLVLEKLAVRDLVVAPAPPLPTPRPVTGSIRVSPGRAA